MSNIAGRRVKRLLVFTSAGVAGALMVASLAFACTLAIGSTYFTDGKTSKTVARGQRISAFATAINTENRGTNVQYKLVIGSNGPHPTHACMVTDFTVNDNVVVPTGDAFIGSHSGPAGDANLPKNTYQLCFKDFIRVEVASSAATLTII